MTCITTNNVTKTYTQGDKTIHAADDITLRIEKGDFVAVIGPSGSGKSTLLQLLGGLDRPTSGTITINGQEVTSISDAKLADLRRNAIGFVFQSFNLIPTLTAQQNVEAAISHRSSSDRQRSLEALKQVGLEHRAHHLPSLLSGGEQQRVAIARALINGPDIILADEPTGNLDSKTGEDIIGVLAGLHDQQGKTVIVISHSESIKRRANRVIEIRDGKVSS